MTEGTCQSPSRRATAALVADLLDMIHSTRRAGVRNRPERAPHRTCAALAAALAAALLVALTGAPSAAADSPPPITVLDSSHVIDFGRAIRFSLRATAAHAPFTEIQARYRPLGPDTVWSYTYARFTPGNTILAEFDIPTEGSAYYPPGVEFDVYYILSDDAGNSLSTRPERIEYLDPRFEWQRRTTGPVTAVSYDVRSSTIDALLDAAADRLPAIMETVGLSRAGEYRAILFSSPAQAEALFPPVSETTRLEHTFAGFAYQEYGLFVLARPRPGMFVHELTHLLVADATRSPRATPVPAWFNEGLAVFFETGSSAASRRSVERAAQRGELLPLSTMNALPGKPDDISIFYPQSGAFVGYVIERFGRTPVAGILQRLDSGLPIADAVEQALGTPLQDLDADFRRWIGAPPAPTRPASPAPDATAAATADATPTAADAAPAQPPTGDGYTGDILVYLFIAAVAGLLIGAGLGRWRKRSRP